MKKWQIAVLLIVGAFLGATVLREPIAWAAQVVDARIIAPLDDRGNVRVTGQPNLTNQFVFNGRLDLDERNAAFTVPAGKVFVVEHFNVSATADTDRTMGVQMIYRVGGTLALGSANVTFIQVPLIPGPSSPHTNHTDYGYDGSPNIKIAAGTYNVALGLQDGIQLAVALFSLDGYLVDAP